METVRETRSVRWWIGTAIYAVAMLAMAISLAWVVFVALSILIVQASDGAGMLAVASLLTVYVAILTFPIAMLVQPSKGRALWFAALTGAYVIVFLIALPMSLHIPFWPRFMRAGS